MIHDTFNFLHHLGEKSNIKLSIDIFLSQNKEPWKIRTMNYDLQHRVSYSSYTIAQCQVWSHTDDAWIFLNYILHFGSCSGLERMERLQLKHKFNIYTTKRNCEMKLNWTKSNELNTNSWCSNAIIQKYFQITMKFTFVTTEYWHYLSESRQMTFTNLEIFRSRSNSECK